MHCTFILQGRVFEYKRVDAIRQRTVINDVMVDVIKAGIWKGSDWVVKAVMYDKHDLNASTGQYTNQQNHKSLKRSKK